MSLLLAQVIAPPLQNGPVRLPGSGAAEERPVRPGTGDSPLQLGPGLESPGSTTAPPSTSAPPGSDTKLPVVEGLQRYSAEALHQILGPCAAIRDPAERLRRCAADLTAHLMRDGYVNTRVYVRPTPAPGSLLVVEGRIVEIRVITDDTWLQRRVQSLLAPLQGRVLHLPSLEQDLRLLARAPGIGQLRANLSRLGSDPAQGVLTVRMEGARLPWQGEVSIRNDGTSGSGDARAVATALKPDLISRGDLLLVYGEVDGTTAPRFGSLISSVSYTLPLAPRWNVTGAFGVSRRNLIELPAPADGFASTQVQGLGQLEWVMQDTLRQRWSLAAAFSGNRSNTFFNGSPLPVSEPASVRMPTNGYLRLGINGSGSGQQMAWNAGAFLLQGVAATTPADQRQELASVGLYPGEARALGALVGASWLLSPTWQLNVRAAGQVALAPLTSPMRFTLGSDTGLRGLPGQLVSGDNGWLGTAELVWTVWQKRQQAVQLVPFVGAGGVGTSLTSLNRATNDTVGSGGILARWLAGRAWTLELGWVNQFATQNNPGPWQNWALGQGLYGKVQYRF